MCICCFRRLESAELSDRRPSFFCELPRIGFLACCCVCFVLYYYICAKSSTNASDITQVRFINGQTLTPMFSDSLAGCTERYGHTLYHYHRVDLHKTLMELARDSSPLGAETLGRPVAIRLCAKVVGVDPVEATLTLEDGLRIQKDLLVIADGINVSLAVTYIVHKLASRRCVYARSVS